MPPPVKVVKRGRWWRLMEPDGTLLSQKFRTRDEALRAARAINANIGRRR